MVDPPAGHVDIATGLFLYEDGFQITGEATFLDGIELKFVDGAVFPADHLDDMQAELAAYRPHELAYLSGEGRFGKLGT